MCPKGADGLANSVDPEQTAPRASVDPDQTAPRLGSTLLAHACLSENLLKLN